MELVVKYKISTKSELIFCKVDLQNRLRHFKYKEFFIFAVLELGTNILKHAKNGEIWLLKDNDEFFLAALDKGEGIKNIEWAIKKGTTSYKNSLGLGLYGLSHHDYYKLEIFTSTTKPKGSIFLLIPRNYTSDIVDFTLNYMDLKKSGDFIVKKRKYYLIGDVSGHGLKANKSVEFIKNLFLKTKISCLLVDEFFKKLHSELDSLNLRGVVLSIVEVLKDRVLICGVGNIGILHKDDNKIIDFFQEKGIVGEIFFKVSKIEIKRSGIILLYSDGIEEKMVYNILQQTDNLVMLVIAAIFFSDEMDDKTILAIGECNE